MSLPACLSRAAAISARPGTGPGTRAAACGPARMQRMTQARMRHACVTHWAAACARPGVFLHPALRRPQVHASTRRACALGQRWVPRAALPPRLPARPPRSPAPVPASPGIFSTPARTPAPAPAPRGRDVLPMLGSSDDGPCGPRDVMTSRREATIGAPSAACLRGRPLCC